MLQLSDKLTRRILELKFKNYFYLILLRLKIITFIILIIA